MVPDYTSPVKTTKNKTFNMDPDLDPRFDIRSADQSSVQTNNSDNTVEFLATYSMYEEN